MEEKNITLKDNPHLYNKSRMTYEKGYRVDTHLINGTKLGFRLKSYFKSIIMLFALLFISVNSAAEPPTTYDPGALVAGNVTVFCNDAQLHGYIEVTFPFYHQVIDRKSVV